MLRYFYNLYFQYETAEENISNIFNIGYFSTKKRAIEILNSLKSKVGFNQYSVECFKISKLGMHLNSEIKDKSGLILFELAHDYEVDEIINWTIFGIYQSKEDAQIEILKQKSKKPYKFFTNGFHINIWIVDKQIEWQDGFLNYTCK